MGQLRWVVLSLCAVGAGVVACSTVEKTAASLFISDEDEEKLGQQVHAELEKQGTRELNDPQVKAYIEGIGQRIFAQSRADRPNVDWHVHVVDDPETVNAFAIPGGHTFVITGLILRASDEAELAGVMAHEAGHVSGRHAARQIVAAYGIDVALAIALGKDPGTLTQLAAAIAKTGALLAHGRSEEHEADEYGVRYVSQAGYDPQGLVRFFQKLQEDEQKGGIRLPVWLSTHPANEDRIQEINDVIAREGLTGSDVGADRIKVIQDRIRALPKDGGP